MIVAERDIEVLKLKQALENNGYQVYWVETSIEAWDRAKLNYFDLIVLDLDPSAEKSLTRYKELKSYPELANLPIVILASRQILSRKLRGFEGSQVHFLVRDSIVEARLLQLIELTHYLRYRYLDLVP